MGKTSIAWTDESSNPIRFERDDNGAKGWQCVKVSPGCKNCYAESLNLSSRIAYGTKLPYTVASLRKGKFFVVEKELRRLERSKPLSGKKVFLEDMSDFLGAFIPHGHRERVMRVIRNRTDATFQILTKRPDNALLFLWDWFENWPAHVWFGTSAENQEWFDRRIVDLLKVPAPVHFLSLEPLLGPIDLQLEGRNYGRDYATWSERVQWVIVGGESGAGHRPVKIDWIEGIVDQCIQAGVPVFVKQDSGLYPGRQGRIPDELFIHEFPTIRDTSGE